ncbi:MAG TPA: adenylosuccinate lyase [Candidatus Saccharimonadales bacterium]|nr:adenylosuccinate lyase [Candidatus Saccharimonadales bacterium]
MKPIQLPMVDASSNFDAIDPVDGRYYDTAIASYLSERSRIAFQAYVEGALAQTLADFGVCSHEIADAISEAATKVTAEAVAEEEKTTKHDVKAVVNVIKSHLNDEAKPFVHFGATSYDIVSTAMALQLRTACDELLVPRLEALQKTLLELTDKYADTVQVGRTHGQHAVPITFGFLMAEYAQRIGESYKSMAFLSTKLKGKFSGATGTYNALSIFVDDPFEFEKQVLAKVGLEPSVFSKQIVPAENIVRFLDEVNVCANVMANLSHDMRNLQRSEIAEVREKFEEGQTGSSTMAHKRNPWNFENVISMSKQVNAQLLNAQLNIVSEHQRDLTDSASARFYGVMLALVASMAKRLNEVMSKLEVDAEQMEKNLYLSGGAIAAEPLYLLLEKYGHTQAHETSKKIAHEAQAAGRSLYEAASTDTSIADYFAKFTDSEKKILENPEKNYTGLAAQKARQIHDFWSNQ